MVFENRKNKGQFYAYDREIYTKRIELKAISPQQTAIEEHWIPVFTGMTEKLMKDFKKQQNDRR